MFISFFSAKNLQQTPFGSFAFRERRGYKYLRLTSLLCCHVRNADTGPVTTHPFHLCWEAWCPCSPHASFPLFFKSTFAAGRFFSPLSIKPTSCWSCSLSLQCSFLITLLGGMSFLHSSSSFSGGCCRGFLIPVRICWSYSIIQHPKCAAVEKHI